MDQTQNLEGFSILVVEDEYLAANELKSLLMADGAKSVRLSGQLSDAVEQVDRDKFQLAILDINIRGDRVYSLADKLRRRKVPFAFITGYDRRDVPARFADIPLWAKPVNNRQFITELRKLRRSGLAAE